MVQNNAVSWFEIPSLDLDRATVFYETVFEVKLIPMDFPNIKMRTFPLQDPASGVGGAIVKTEGFHQPSATQGVLLYLNANPDVQQVLDRVAGAGGKVIVPKTEISADYGHIGVFVDTEGNRIAVHSVPQKVN